MQFDGEMEAREAHGAIIVTERRLYWSISAAVALVLVAVTGNLVQAILLALLPGVIELIELGVLEPVHRGVDLIAGKSASVGILFRGDRRLLPTFSAQMARIGRRAWSRRQTRSYRALRPAHRDVRGELPVRGPSRQRGTRTPRRGRSGSGRRSASHADSDGSDPEPSPSDDFSPLILNSFRSVGEVRK